MSYLLNLQLLQKERERRHGKRLVMDSSRMTMAGKSLPNMGTCGVHWMVSSSCLKGLVSLCLHLHYRLLLCLNNINGKLYISKYYRVYYSLNWRHVMMTCLTWRTLQSKVFILHFNQHFNMPWSGRRKTTNEYCFKLFNKKAKNGDGEKYIW